MGWAWTYLVVAELVAASSGLGYISMKAMRGFQVDVIFLAIAIIGVLGLITDQAFRLLRMRLAPGRSSEGRGGGEPARHGQPKLTCARRHAPTTTSRTKALSRRSSDISFDVADKEFAVIVGPSGCGKSSLLYLAAGLTDPTDGEILIDDRVIDGPGADRGMVFQSYTLFPWLNVREERRVRAEAARHAGRRAAGHRRALSGRGGAHAIRRGLSRTSSPAA